MRRVVAAFPALAHDEFVEACEQLEAVSEYRLSPGVIPALRLSRSLSSGDNSSSEAFVNAALGQCAGTGQADGEDEAEDGAAEDEVREPEDDAAIAKLNAEPCTEDYGREPPCHVVYDIVLSPVYRVPVVYLQFKATPGKPLLDIAFLRDRLVPATSRSAVDLTGVYGALSMTEHPITGLPAYFVHPCRTADALRAISAKGQISPLEYLLLWFGIIGLSVGLTVPMDVGMQLKNGFGDTDTDRANRVEQR